MEWKKKEEGKGARTEVRIYETIQREKSQEEAEGEVSVIQCLIGTNVLSGRPRREAWSIFTLLFPSLGVKIVFVAQYRSSLTVAERNYRDEQTNNVESAKKKKRKGELQRTRMWGCEKISVAQYDFFLKEEDKCSPWCCNKCGPTIRQNVSQINKLKKENQELKAKLREVEERCNEIKVQLLKEILSEIYSLKEMEEMREKEEKRLTS